MPLFNLKSHVLKEQNNIFILIKIDHTNSKNSQEKEEKAKNGRSIIHQTGCNLKYSTN